MGSALVQLAVVSVASALVATSRAGPLPGCGELVVAGVKARHRLEAAAPSASGVLRIALRAALNPGDHGGP